MIKLRQFGWIFLLLGFILIGLSFWHSRSVLGISTVAPKFDYTIVLVGDSMTEYLGNLKELELLLKDYYPGKTFLLLNYGFSSTNVLSLQDRLTKDSPHDGRTFQPINQIPFDLVLIESFGHNPLSAFPLDEGLQKQSQALDQTVASLTSNHPKSSIVFVATLAPNKDHYGQGLVDLSPEARQDWVTQRQAYIQNHIDYANSHEIPLIDIYDQSMKNGTGDLSYINQADNIHPSQKGIYFISQQIAKFVYENKLLK